MKYEIHSVLFDKAKWTTEKARAELASLNVKPIKRVEKSEEMLRYRITRPFKNVKYFSRRMDDKGMTIVFQIKN